MDRGLGHELKLLLNALKAILISAIHWSESCQSKPIHLMRPGHQCQLALHASNSDGLAQCLAKYLSWKPARDSSAAATKRLRAVCREKEGTTEYTKYTEGEWAGEGRA